MEKNPPETMWRFRISWSHGGEAPFNLFKVYYYTSKEKAIVNAFKLVRPDIDLKWEEGEGKDEIHFQFIESDQKGKFYSWKFQLDSIETKEIIDPEIGSDFFKQISVFK